jgi:allantoate deiminase
MTQTSATMTVTHTERASRAIDRCRQIADCTEVAGEITRTFLSPPMRGVHTLLRGWMEAAGMQVRVDAVGNLRGVWAGLTRDAPRLVIGSHLDTVPNAGAFDGILGVVMGVSIVEELRGQHLPFAIEVIGFPEEEGVRFSRPFLGSLALVGKLSEEILSLTDANGITVAEAIDNFGLGELSDRGLERARAAEGTFAYLEFHIEQGPLLESEGLPLGVVSALVGQSRLLLQFTGAANHAGTTPMHLRHDAMAAAAEWIVSVEKIAAQLDGLVATVGSVQTKPGAGNVIAGEVNATLDLRHANDATRTATLAAILHAAQQAADARGIAVRWEQRIDQPAVPLDPELIDLLDAAVRGAGLVPCHMVSGAGHDAMVVAGSMKSCMLFLRTPGGVSHHPSETVLPEDIEVALAAGLKFVQLLQPLAAEYASSAKNIRP